MSEVAINYGVKCDNKNCNGKAMLIIIDDFNGSEKRVLKYYCKKCKRITYRWQ